MKIFKTLLVAIVILLVFAGGTSAFAYGGESLPGELMYPFKIMAEKAVSLTIMDPGAKAEFSLQRAERRLNEAAKLSEQTGTESEITALISTAKLNLEDVGTLKATLSTEQLSLLEPKLQNFQSTVLLPLNTTLPELKKIEGITWLNPQPEPPLPETFDQLDPQPEPPAPLESTTLELETTGGITNTKLVNSGLNPQPEPPAELPDLLTETDSDLLINEKLVTGGLNPQPEPPAVDPNLLPNLEVRGGGGLGTGLDQIAINPQPEPPGELVNNTIVY